MDMKQAREALAKNPFEPMVDADVLSISDNPFMTARMAFHPRKQVESFMTNMKHCRALL